MGNLAVLLLSACSEQGLRVQAPQLHVEPEVLDFGDVPPGTRVARSFDVVNDGPGPVTLTGVELTGSFTLVEGLPDRAIPDGDRHAITLAWTAGTSPAQGLAEIRAAETSGALVTLVGTPWTEDPAVDALPPDERTEDGVVVGDPTAETLASGSFVLAGGVDLAFLLDTTQSMQTLVSAVADELDAIAVELSSEALDVRFGVATYEDYPVVPFGTPGVDLPFVLRAPVTDDLPAVRAALDAVVIHQGQDAPEASLEALAQALGGRGWDLACDGAYDPRTDVPPFAPSADDAFGGTAPGAGPGEPDARGGFGFGPGRIPVVLYATNYELRDADDPRYDSPGGCPRDAGMTDVVAEAAALGARLVGVGVNVAETSVTHAQMRRLAQATGSVADLDGDGTTEPAALRWSGSSATFRAEVVRGVRDVLAAMRWAQVVLEVEDPQGVVIDVQPRAWTDVRAGEQLAYVARFAPLAAGATARVVLRLVAPAEGDTPARLLGRTVVELRGAP
ncbi:MAG: hypothetical protein RLZZ299_991 [Pseudomonadota bacterium]